MDTGDQITVEMRLAALEEKLDRVLAHLGLDGDYTGGAGFGTDVVPGSMTGSEAQIAALIQAGKKIQAIKVYRDVTGAGLKDAKDAVESMERNMRANGGWR